MIPFNKLTKIVKNKEFQFALAEIYERTQFIGGKHVDALEEKLSECLNIKHAITCANGTDALQIALRSLGIGPGSKVIVPDLTFWATLEAVVNVGAEPIIVDIEAQYFGLDFNLVEEAHSKLGVDAIILVNLFGYGIPCQPTYMRWCQERGIKLVVDNAQAYGVKIDGGNIFSDCDIATTSFYPAKILGASGDAGSIFTSSDELAVKIRSIANHGRSSHYSYSDIGFNSRMDSIQALYLLEKIKGLNREMASRRIILERYKREIQNPNIFVHDVINCQPNGYLNVCTADPLYVEDVILKNLKKFDIGFSRVYPETLAEQFPSKTFKNYLNGTALKFTRGVFNLPVFSDLDDAQQAVIIETINGVES